MGKDSRIGWTHHSFNPWHGCVKVSPACKNCYAAGVDARFSEVGAAHWGTDARRKFMGDRYWQQPLKWDRAAEKAGDRHRVFCASMADVFEELSVKHPDYREMRRSRARLWDLIVETPHLDWLLLTKRPENISEMLPWAQSHRVMPNVWLGVTAENQAEADSRIPYLLAVPAAVRFVSYEPALEKLLLDDGATSWLTCDGRKLRGNGGHCCEEHDIGGTHFRGIDWVIAGCESGPRKREMDLGWVRSVRDQCSDADVAFFFKQMVDIDGKKIEAPYLDGRQWQEVPNAQA